MKKRNILALCLILCLMPGILFGCGTKPVSSADDTKSAPADSMDLELTETELNYFFIDRIIALQSDFFTLNQLKEEGFDPTLALNEQQYQDEAGKTWADYFIEEALHEAAGVYGLCNAARKAGYTLTAEDKTSLEEVFQTIKEQSKLYGYESPTEYLKAVYGGNHQYRISDRTFEEDYARLMRFAEEHNHYTIDEEFWELPFPFETDDDARSNNVAICAEIIGCTDLRDLPSQLANLPNGFDQAVFYTEYNKTLLWAEEEGSYDSEILMSKIGTPLDEDPNIYNYVPDEDLPDGHSYFMIVYHALSYDLDDIRDLPDHLYQNPIHPTEESYRAYLERATLARSYYDHYTKKLTFSSDQIDAYEKENSAYYKDYFGSEGTHLKKMISVRHILISYEGGIYDEETFSTIYTEEEKKAAVDKIAEIKAEWEKSEQTSEYFGMLAKKYTDDSNGDQGGLYEHIYPGWAVSAFNDWCFDENRKSGDVGVVQTEYGCHLIYFVGKENQTYREYVLTTDMRAEATEKWFETIRSDYRTHMTVPSTEWLYTGFSLTYPAPTD